MSAIPSVLDGRSKDTRWSLHADGIRGRALIVAAGAAYTVPLALPHELTLRTRAALLAHDWLNGLDAVHAVVSTTDRAGRERVRWEGELPAGDRGRPRGAAVEVTLPADTALLQFSVRGPARVRHRSVARAAWVTPVLLDPDWVAPVLLDPEAPIGPAPVTARPSVQTPRPLERPAGAPLISVLTPVHDPPPEMLAEAVQSVLAQTFTDWELCLVDDGSRDPAIVAALARHAAGDRRIKLATHDRARGIAAATNRAIELASGRFVAFLDHDDTLTPDALKVMADRLAAEPDLDMVYSDEDIVLDGRRVWAHLKPAWSPDTMRTNGYTCHLGVYRRELVQEIGGLREEFNGSQDVDMILRLMERTDRVGHVPRILYHWRAHTGSTAGGDAKPYAYVAARNAIAGHLRRVGVDAEVGFGPPGLYRLAHRVDPGLGLDLALATDDPGALHAAAVGWMAEPHPSWQVTVCTRTETAIADALARAGVPEERMTVLGTAGDDDHAGMLDRAARAGSGAHLLLMTSPAIGLTHDWLGRLLGYCAQPGVGAAGPVVVAPDGRIRQAGIALPEGLPLALLHGGRSSMDDLFGFGTSVYNVSAVSDVLAMSREVFGQLGGLDVERRGLALIDLCLRAGQAGHRTVTIPDARVQTGAQAPFDVAAVRELCRAWRRRNAGDPYYNPGFRTDRGDFAERA